MTKPEALSSSIVIEELHLRDAIEAHRVFVDAVKHHFTYFDNKYKRTVLRDNNLARMAAAVLRPRRLLYVAKHKGKIIGYVLGSVPATGPAQIYWLFVAPDFRGSNTGLRLLSRILKEMERRQASEAVLITHDYADYYARQGFKKGRTVKRGDVDEYILTYPIGKGRQS